MEKLELKHIVGYLPYGLKLEHTNSLSDKKVIEAEGLQGEWIYVGKKPYHLPDCKPILTKELSEEDYDKIATILENENDTISDKEWVDYYIKEKSLGCDIRQHLEVLDYLYSIHYDIHGLIDKGLAITKND